MQKRGLLPVALAALLASPAIAGGATTLMPGVTYERQRQLIGGSVVVLHVVRTPPHGGLYQLRPVLSQGTVRNRATVPSMQRSLSRQATTVGINGDFFSWASGSPTGVFVRNGVLSTPPAVQRSAVAIAFDGRLLVDRFRFLGSWKPGGNPAHPLKTVNRPLLTAPGVALYTRNYGGPTPRVPGAVEVVLTGFPRALVNGTLTGTVAAVRRHGGTVIPRGGAVLQTRGFWRGRLLAEAPPGTQITVRLQLVGLPDDAADAIGGGPLLVRNGQPVQQPDEYFSLAHLVRRHPRTAVGQLANGRLIFVVADGRSSISAGVSNWNMARTMVRLGAVTAMGFDGGGSSTISVDGRVLNRPSDGAPRAVAEGLFLFYHGVYAPKPPLQLLTPNGDGVTERTTLTAKVVRRSTVDLRLLRPDGTVAWRYLGAVLPGKIRRTVGAPVMRDGVWKWVVEATEDQSGRVSRMTRTFKVNRTLGHLRLSKQRMGVVPRLGGQLYVSAVLTRRAKVGVVVLTAGGQMRRVLYKGELGRGKHSWRWDGRRAAGVLVPGGPYVIRIRAANQFGTVMLRDTVRVVQLAG